MCDTEEVKIPQEPHKPTRKGSEYPDYYLFKGSHYEELFHWAARDDHDWTEKARTGNKRCFLDGTTVLLDNRIVVALFDPEHKRVLRVTDEYSPPVAWTIKWSIQRAFEHWEILDTQSETVEGALDVLKRATMSYKHKRGNGSEWPEEFALERYENTCKFFDVLLDMQAIVEHKDARQAWRDRAKVYQDKREEIERKREEYERKNQEEAMEAFKNHCAIAGIISDTKSYSQNFKAVERYEWPDEFWVKYRRYFNWNNKLYDRNIQEMLGRGNIDAVWVNHKHRSFNTSRGVTVPITDDLIKLIEMVIKATPNQREKFVGRHVGSFSIQGFDDDDTVRVGCHTFLLSDLPALVEEWKNPSEDEQEAANKELLSMIEAERIAVDTHQETLQKLLTEAAKYGITVSQSSQEVGIDACVQHDNS